MKKIEKLILGAIGTNCYLLWNNQHVLIVDPGSKNGKIQTMIEEQEGIVDGIYLTHGHFDHIAGVDTLVDKYHCPVYINALDLPLLRDPALNVSQGMGEIVVKADVVGLQPGENTIGAFTFTLQDAPGHSEGSCLMLWDEHMICGDVLFQGSIGRCDLPQGSNTKMHQTLQEIKMMDPNYIVYPGHGETTTLQAELQYNPYLR